MFIPRIGIVAVVFLAIMGTPLLAETIHVPKCLVVLIDQSQVAAQESGVLSEVFVHAGQQVVKDQLLAKVDDNLAILQRNVAEAEFKVAEKESKNYISVQYAEATAKVAYRECRRHQEANAKIKNAIAQSDVDKAKLALVEANTYIEKAIFDLEIKKEQVKVKHASLTAADEHISRRTVTAPWAGVVDEIGRHKGDWVEPGNPILLLVRMDKLYVKCALDKNLYNPFDVDGKRVQVTVHLARGQRATFDGTVSGISPRVVQGNKFQIWAEVNNKQKNDYWILRPGMNASMEIFMN